MDDYCNIVVVIDHPLTVAGFDSMALAVQWLKANGFIRVETANNILSPAPAVLPMPHPRPYVYDFERYQRGNATAILHNYLYPHQPTRLKVLLGDKPREFRFWDDHGLEWQVTIAPPNFKVWLSDGDYDPAFTPVTPTFTDFDELIDWLLSRKDIDFWEQRLA